MQIGKYPCYLCDKGVRKNSEKCTECQLRVHKRFFGVYESFNKEKDFACKKCIFGMLFQDEDKMINLNENNIAVMNRFSYLSDVLNTEGGAQEAEKSRIKSA